MAMVESSVNSEIGMIQREMARARRQIHEDVGGAIDGVQTLTDWRSIVRSHPWLSMGIAAGIGFMVVPRRRKETPAAPRETHGVRDDHFPEPAPRIATGSAGAGNWSLLLTALSVVSPIAIRLAQSYALR